MKDSDQPAHRTDFRLALCVVLGILFWGVKAPGTEIRWQPAEAAGTLVLEVPAAIINMTDLQRVILAFEGGPYPFGAPASCP